MKKLMAIVLPLKSFASLIFTGFIVVYMFAATIYAIATGAEFSYAIPFSFIILGLALSMLTSVLWGLFFSGAVIKKLRYFARLALFGLCMLALFAGCLLVFANISAQLAKLWLIVAAGVAVVVTALSCLNEIYLRKTGKRYMDALLEYKSKVSDNNKGANGDVY